MAANNKRFMNSVSGVAMMTALAMAASSAKALPFSFDQTLAPGTANFGVPTDVFSINDIDIESSDPNNHVVVTGIIEAKDSPPAGANHLNATVLHVTGWDIEASGADHFWNGGPVGGALAENLIDVKGSIQGVLGNLDYAPGSNSSGIVVEDDIEAKDAFADADFVGAADTNVGISAIARNAIDVQGGVAGSSTNSDGVVVFGNVEAYDAHSDVWAVNNDSDVNQRSAGGTARALNVVGITGVVGGEGASNDSIGVYIGGDAYAANANVDSNDGGANIWIQAGGFSVNAAAVVAYGNATMTGQADNSVAIDGSIVGDGGNDAIGVHVNGSVFASNAWAAGEALSRGGDGIYSFASADVTASNTVLITGTQTGPGTDAIGVVIGEGVWAEGSTAIGRALSSRSAGDGDSYASVQVQALNTVTITGTATGDTSNIGVDINGIQGVGASFAEANGWAGANSTFDGNGIFEDVANATSEILVHAINSVAITGTASGDGSVGVAIAGSVYAFSASANGYADANASTDNDPDAAAVANASGFVLALNSIEMTGNATGDNATGIDPINVTAENAFAVGSFITSALSVDGPSASATSNGDVLASNFISQLGTVADSLTGATGIDILGFVSAFNADAYGYVEANATQTSNFGGVSEGATANGVGLVRAVNEISITGTVGNDATNSTGVRIGGDVTANFAEADGYVYATALVQNAGNGNSGDAIATAEGGVYAANTITIAGTVGVDGNANVGVWIGEGVHAGTPAGFLIPIFSSANAWGYTSASATVNGTGINGGDGLASATAEGTVQAFNRVTVNGTVGNLDDGASIGVYIGEGVTANFAEASGQTFANADVSYGTGNALANATGIVIADNTIIINGTVGTTTEDSIGVQVAGLLPGPGPFGHVRASNAFAEGYTQATADNSGGTASIPADATANTTGRVAAVNQVTMVGQIGIDGSDNYGVWIGQGVIATFAEAQGGFTATANRNGAGDGNAGATIGTDALDGEAKVQAFNTISLTGSIADDNTDNGDSGNGNTGVYVGFAVNASDALATGDFNANANRNDAGDGNASATIYGDVRAVNEIVIGGTVGTWSQYSNGVFVDNTIDTTYALEALFAEAHGTANADASRNDGGHGNATSLIDLTVVAGSAIRITGAVSPEGSYNTGVRIDGGIDASFAEATGYADALASRQNTGNGNTSATANTDVTAVNVVEITGSVGDYGAFSEGVQVNGAIRATNAFALADSRAVTNTTPTFAGTPGNTQTALAGAESNATNLVTIVGNVGQYAVNSFGVDPSSILASNAHAQALAEVDANGPESGTATANASAVAENKISLTGTIANNASNSTGILIQGGLTAEFAWADASTNVQTDDANNGQVDLNGSATANATARNSITIGGQVGTNADDSHGVFVGGDLVMQGLRVELNGISNALNNTDIVSTGTGLMENVANITGIVGNYASDSRGVNIDGSVLFRGSVQTTLQDTTSAPGTGSASLLQRIEGYNRATIQGSVGTDSPGSIGVRITGNVEVVADADPDSNFNTLVSRFLIGGSDLTNDGNSRGVWIGGSILTGDATDSLVASNAVGVGIAAPVIVPATQVGDFVELYGSLYVGANGGANPYGVAVGDGNDQVLVRDTHFQMNIVNGFDGGDNLLPNELNASPQADGQDEIRFSNAQIYVSNIDNFELLNVFNRSFVILTNPTQYVVDDFVASTTYVAQVNIFEHGVLALNGGTGGIRTEYMTVGGINGVKSGAFDDAIFKAEAGGTGNYVIDLVEQRNDGSVTGTFFNFATVTLSNVLSPTRGTDPHGLLYNSATSFDEIGEQQVYAVNGGWNIDPTSAPGDLLTINGNYTAGSNLILDAFVKFNGPSDVFVVNGGDVTGVTTIWVNNTNTTGVGAFTGRGPTDGILLVDINNGQSIGDINGTFVLGNTSGWNWADPVNFPEPEIQVGAFVYDLEQKGTDGKDFYLQSRLLDQVPAYTVAATALQQHWYTELGTLYQRLGELRHGDMAPRDTKNVEFWMRGVGAMQDIDPNKGFSFDMTTFGFMVGGDYAWRNAAKDKSRIHIGGFFGYGKSKLDDIDGPQGNSDLETDGWTIGAYVTYFDTMRKGQGLYADAVVKVNFMDTDYSSSSRHTKAKSSDFAWGTSLEVGYGIGIGNGFIIQPQGQLSYMQVSGEKFRESSTPGIPLSIDRETAESLRGRLGVQLQNTWTNGSSQFSPYVIANVIHEFLGDNKTTVSGTPFRNDMGGTWYNAGGGLTWDISNLSIFGHLEYTFGGNVEGIGGGLGFKYRW